MPSPCVPRFSVVIPTYRRPAQLTTCLEALAQLDYPRDRFEVVVVDDGGDFPLDGIVTEHASTLKLELVRQSNAGAASARNAGAQRATGDVVAFLDDDCTPSPTWLRALAEGVRQHPDALLGGRTQNGLPNNSFSTAAERILGLVYRHYNADPEHPTFFASNNIALAVAGFRALGGFDRRFARAAAEDRDFCDRWLAAGGRLAVVEDAVVHHAHALGLRGFCRMYFNYGRGAYHFHRLRAERGYGPIRVDTDFHVSALREMVRGGSPRARVTQLGLFGAWQLANAAGFARELFAARVRQINASADALGA